MGVTPCIETDRLLLRQMSEGDFTDFLEYFTEPSINKFLGGFMPIDEDGASAVFRAGSISAFTWAVELKSEKRVIGDVHFGNVVGGYLAHIGYVFNKNYWGNGYAFEAVSAVTNYGFTVLNFGRIRAVTQLCNVRSQRLLEKCGFIREALIYDGDFNGRIDDICLYSIRRTWGATSRP